MKIFRLGFLTFAVFCSTVAELSSYAFGAEKNCPATEERVGSLAISRKTVGDRCMIELKNQVSTGAAGKSYVMDSDGSFSVRYPGLGTHLLYFLPHKQELAYAIAADRKSVSVLMPSGGKIEFSAAGGALTSMSEADLSGGASDSPTDFWIRPKPSKVLLDLGFQKGETQPARNAFLVDGVHPVCLLQNREMLSFPPGPDGTSSLGPRLRFMNDRTAYSFLTQKCPQVDLSSLGSPQPVRTRAEQDASWDRVITGLPSLSAQSGVSSGARATVVPVLSAPLAPPKPVLKVAQAAPKVSAAPVQAARRAPSLAPVAELVSARLDGDSVHQCLDILKSFSKDQIGLEKVKAYLAIQGQLSLHRLAWAYLKLNSGTAKTLSVEKTIEQLLRNRDPELYRKFIATDQRAGSNTKLRLAMDFLKTSINDSYGKEARNAPYLLRYSDVKALELIAAAENTHGIKKDGVISLVQMIDSSYRNRMGSPALREENRQIAEQYVKQLQLKEDHLGDELEDYLKKNGCENPAVLSRCNGEGSPVGAAASLKLMALLADSQQLQNALLGDLAERKDELKQPYQWGTYWLHVSRRQNAN